MTKNRSKYFKQIIDLYLNNDFPKQVEDDVKIWFAEDEFAQEKDEALRQYWDSMPTLESDYTRRNLTKLKYKLGILESPKRNIWFSKKILFRVAAVLIPALVIIGGLFLSLGGDETIEHNVISVSVPAGRQKLIVLPDNSEIWMNSSSKIEYDENFVANRNVKLTGEAYFNVTRDENHPFIVVYDGLEVEVLGTKFNISSAGMQQSVLLESGKVEVRTKSGSRILSPNETLIYDKTKGSIEVSTGMDDGKWWTSSISFRRQTLTQILSALGEIYGVEIHIEKTSSRAEDTYSFSFDRERDIRDILDVITEYSATTTYNIDGQRITVSI